MSQERDVRIDSICRSAGNGVQLETVKTLTNQRGEFYPASHLKLVAFGEGGSSGDNVYEPPQSCSYHLTRDQVDEMIQLLQVHRARMRLKDEPAPIPMIPASLRAEEESLLVQFETYAINSEAWVAERADLTVEQKAAYVSQCTADRLRLRQLAARIRGET